jgi:hypothetical protein
MGKASKTTSLIYRQMVPKEERCREKYQEVVRMVMRELARYEQHTKINTISTTSMNRHE